MKPILFVHIPKTAGTSLHQSAIDSLGANCVERDNGNSENLTSELIKEYFYADKPYDHFGYYEAFKKADKKWLTGHLFAERLLPLFGAENTISFVRDPIDRVISNYQFMKSIDKTSLSFEDYYQAPEETNKQFRMIGQTPWKAYHLVGTLEHYNDCLSLLSHTKQLNLEIQKLNIRQAGTNSKVSETVRSDIQKWNERDCIFFEEVNAYLIARLKAHRSNIDFCYHDMGFVPDQHVIGWAFYSGSDTAVTVDLYVDSRHTDTYVATEHRPELQVVKTPRQGHNGFRFSLEHKKNAEHIELRARETGQILLDWHRS